MKDYLLIIDDELDTCILLTSILKKQGFKTKYALNLKEGWNIFSEGTPAGVLLDINLPDGKGYNLIPQIKGVENPPFVIVVSALGGDNKKIAFEKGADFYMQKPFKIEKVINTIRECTN
ncbi:response regulator [Flammeovirgaceae bacterium SG7u.111]|nr:response regulator [Flammeovirgaceae bacterium SG7u.132]WPO34362.1 response regulator [Flammeovirgaceae bacterium SG7u.111]